MPGVEKTLEFLESGMYRKIFEKLYGYGKEEIENQTRRYVKAVKKFNEIFPGRTQIELFSTPGRTELGGNHTDHNAGRVLSAAVDIDVIAVVSPNDSGIINVCSEGYPANVVDTRELAPIDTEKYTSSALIRGICARLKELGFNIGGFDAYTTSNVPKGSGLSSSAAFEVLIVSVLNHLYNDGKIDDIMNAKIARYAENNYFGKPCGLMDQITCAVGGFVTIDFKDLDKPIVRKVSYDFSSSGFSVVIVNTGGSHADLTEDYAVLEQEMKSVAAAFGGKVLREFNIEKVLEGILDLRQKTSDRAILRALHFYSEDQRVEKQVKALEEGDFNKFLELVIESGYSSWMLCQNCYSPANVREQGIPLALAVSEKLLYGKGAWRVHGGGFAGTVQSFVPNSMLDEYISAMQSIFGKDSCHVLMVRPIGTAKIGIT